MTARDSTATRAAKRRGGSTARTRGGWKPTGTAADRRGKIGRGPDWKGSRTRQRLLDAARGVFQQHGYVDATVEHIVSEAGVARGSFYTYFESKAEIFRQLAIEVDLEVTREVGTFERPVNADPVLNLELSNRRYLEVVKQNADVYALIDQVASFDARVKKGRLRSRQKHIRRVARSIERWQHDGYADPEVDPLTTAAALVSMLSSFAYWLYAGGDSYDEKGASDTLTAIWIKATGLKPTPAYSQPARRS